jgi:predicted nuclease of restriction endonuclease-like (RecB) superfamily
MDFNLLISQISDLHTHLHNDTVRAVNIRLSIRNWMIGYYIVEYEQNGQDRAQYGSKLLANIAAQIQIKGLTAPELSRTRQFYLTYASLSSVLIANFQHILSPNILGSLTQDSSLSILGSMTQESQEADFKYNKKYYSDIFTKISYTHFAELIKISNSVKRKYYEMAIIKECLSVRELERQIASLTYERVGMSGNIDQAINSTEDLTTSYLPADVVKSVYVFDFLNLPHPRVISETDLEAALIDHIQEFILELGNGFCFEARQKRILIDDEYYFIDLVFYHRILKSHIIIELKVDKFKHEHLSQLNSYVAYYNDQIKQIDDNPAIGILLCTQKGEKMVEYALSGMNEKLFVSQYLVHLPDKEKLQAFIEQELRKL